MRARSLQAGQIRFLPPWLVVDSVMSSLRAAGSMDRVFSPDAPFVQLERSKERSIASFDLIRRVLAGPERRLHHRQIG